MVNDPVRDALRALQIAVAVEIPLGLAFLLVGFPTTYRPNFLAMLPAIAHIPGVLLLGPVQPASRIVSSSMMRLPIEQVATLAAGNVIVFSVVGFLFLRLWTTTSRAADGLTPIA